MKKLFLIVATLVITAGVFASNPLTGTKYICPKCGYSADKAGKCSHCKVALVKEGDYYCDKDGISSAKAGKCSKCGGTMVKMEAKKKDDAKKM